jgi:adenylate kinase
MGPPACGKGTQARRLREKYGLPHISSGDILRDEVARGTDFGIQIKQYMDRGEIGPAALITDMVLAHVGAHCPDGFILDGFPRTIFQAWELMKEHDLDAAFLIDVSEEEVLRRITGRRVCSVCGNICTIHRDASDSGLCASCGGKLVQRDDDNEETARNRLSVYTRETVPVAGFYQDRGVLKRIPGARSPEEIFADITVHLERPDAE